MCSHHLCITTTSGGLSRAEAAVRRTCHLQCETPRTVIEDVTAIQPVD